jgi:hypothetical protein
LREPEALISSNVVSKVASEDAAINTVILKRCRLIRQYDIPMSYIFSKNVAVQFPRLRYSESTRIKTDEALLQPFLNVNMITLSVR